MISFCFFWQDAAAAIDNMVRTLFPLACGEVWLCRVLVARSEALCGGGYRGKTSAVFLWPLQGFGGHGDFFTFWWALFAFFPCRMSPSSSAGQSVWTWPNQCELKKDHPGLV